MKGQIPERMAQDRESRNRTVCVCVCETDFCKGVVSSMNSAEIIEICRQKGKQHMHCTLYKC